MKLDSVREDLKVVKCQHVSLEVSNVDNSLEFYRNFLAKAYRDISKRKSCNTF